MPGQVVLENVTAGEWRDTVQIPVRGNVTFRMQPKDFVGTFPYHCHVTAHQDIGMMQLAEVVATEKECPAKEEKVPATPPATAETAGVTDPNSSQSLLSKWKCPSWFGKPICDIECVVAHCGKEISRCVEDHTCRERLGAMNSCMQNKTTSPYYPGDCLVPDNQILDQFLHCAMEVHQCLNSTIKPPVYPACRDDKVVGDSAFELSQLSSPPGRTWYKVHGWLLGEPIECMPCQTATFTSVNNTNTRSPAVTFESTWLNPDEHNVLWHTNATATLKYRGENSVHSKLFNQVRERIFELYYSV